MRRRLPAETAVDVIRADGGWLSRISLTGVYQNMARGIVALVFRCKVVSGHLPVNDEVSGFQWVTPEEVKAMADGAERLDLPADAHPVRRQRPRRPRPPQLRPHHGRQHLTRLRFVPHLPRGHVLDPRL